MCPSCQVAIWKAWPDPRGPPSRQPSQSTNRDPCSVAWGAWAKTCKRSPLNRTMTLILKGGATGLGMPNNKSQVAKKDQKESKTGTEISRDSSQSHFIQICYHQIPPFRPNAFDSKAAGIGKGLKGCPWKTARKCWNMPKMSGNCCGAWVFEGYFLSVRRLWPMLCSSAIQIHSLALSLSRLCCRSYIR